MVRYIKWLQNFSSYYVAKLPISILPSGPGHKEETSNFSYERRKNYFMVGLPSFTCRAAPGLCFEDKNNLQQCSELQRNVLPKDDAK
jgi:hypothetical protein